MDTIVIKQGLYYWKEGDPRRHVDVEKARKLWESIPDYWDDTCPNCGNKEQIDACRCPTSHRFCPVCKFSWHWRVNFHKACIEIVP